MTTGDFNGDGIADLATANFFSDNVSVLLGNGSGGVGDGTFAPQITYAAGDAPYGVTTGDFNGDGITDLATANYSSDNLSVLLGNGSGGTGDGTFAARVTYAVGDGPWSVTTGDFNGDGIIDLATANFNSDNVSVLLGNGSPDMGSGGMGDGTFAAPVNYAAWDGPRSVTTGDFNGDGITDLATANRDSDNVTVLLGNGSGGTGNGTFLPVTYAAGDAPSSVTTGDFNGDGITDLATANRDSDNVSVLLGRGSGGTGDGTFAARVNYAAGSGASSVTTGDFNGDGITDLATANWDSDNVSVLMGNGSEGTGDGTFAAPVAYPTGVWPYSVTTGDFNGDGIIDLATANQFSDDVSVLLGNGSGGIGNGTFAPQLTYAAGDHPTSMTTGDFNGDGITDLATANLNSDNVSVLLGNGSEGTGDWTFASPVIYAIGDAPTSVTRGDFNGDSITDLATANYYSDDVSVLLGNGSGGTGDGAFAAHVKYEAGDAPWGLTTGDFNGDGITDLATANRASDNVSALMGNGSGGIGNGTFAPQLTYAAGDQPQSLTTGDFNGDGLTDLATANVLSDNVSVLLNLGFADVTAPTSQASGPAGSLTQQSPIIDVTYITDDTHLGSSGVATVELFYQRNGGGYVSHGAFTTSPISFDTTGTGGDGTYDFYTVATDNAGNKEAAPEAADVSVTFNDTSSVADWSMQKN